MQPAKSRKTWNSFVDSIAMKRLALSLLLGLMALEAFGAPPARTGITLPPEIREQFLMNMRDHLSAISEIQAALAKGRFHQAADIAKDRIGLGASSSEACRMSGMAMHKEASPNPLTDNRALSGFMPESMHKIGFGMHAAADQFAQDARKAAKTGDYRMAIASLSRVTTQCIACHARFKLNSR